MLQVLQNLRNGDTESAEIPRPAVGPGHVLVQSRASLISAGTERMLLEFGKANWIEKARRQPDKLRMVLQKIRTDGVAATVESVRAKLDQPVALGYSNAGVVVEVGPGVTAFAPGDRVVSNGAHAEFVSVPQNLCAKIPGAVTDDAAAFTVVGAIALQGIRLAQPSLGEAFVVAGLGLIGLMAVQLLRAHGCRVLGIDFDPGKLDLARAFGAETVDLSRGEDALAAAARFSRGRGVDAVLIAAATPSSQPVHQAALMCRKRGRIVLVGVTGLQLSRDDFYQKELTFQVSCSYGPGRYDHAYESGQDYPHAFVRWTAQRNFEAVLDLLAAGALDVAPLITHRFPVAGARAAYELVGGGQPYLGVLLEYPAEPDRSRSIALRTSTQPRRMVTGAVAFIGAGSYATKVLLPSFRSAGARLKTIASAAGLSAAHAGRKFGFESATTDCDAIFEDPEIGAVVIATRHDSHARLVCRAIETGKHVFVEKPLALTRAELDQIEALYRSLETPPLLMVGFNRRFAPQVQEIKALLAAAKDPPSFVLTVNAGVVPSDHWTQDPQIGGGRIVGEGCHFVDLLRFLAASPVTWVQAASLGRAPGLPGDTATFTLSFASGSVGTVHYFANGHRSFPKERLEVFAGGRILQLDNFRRLRARGWPGFRGMNLWRQDKGNRAAVAAFVDALRAGAPSPIPFEELMEVSRVTLDVAASLR